METDWISIIGYSTWIVSPVCLCFFFPAQKVISRIQKELLAASVGTICAFTFFEVIPAIIDHRIKSTFVDMANVVKKGHPQPQLVSDTMDDLLRTNRWDNYAVSITILFGMFIAALLSALHEFMEHKHCDEQHEQTTKEGVKNKQNGCLSWIPGTCKVVWMGTALHNLADGMIIGLTPKWEVALSLFIHELTHTLCNVTFYITMGMHKSHAIVLRIASCIFVFIGSLGAQLEIIKHFHAYGHAIVLGIFLYMMLVDMLPILTGSQPYNHCVEPQSDIHECTKQKLQTSQQLATAETDADGQAEAVDIEQPTETTVEQDENHSHDDHHHHHNEKYTTKKKKGILLLVFLASLVSVAALMVAVKDPHHVKQNQDCCSSGNTLRNVWAMYNETSSSSQDDNHHGHHHHSQSDGHSHHHHH